MENEKCPVRGKMLVEKNDCSSVVVPIGTKCEKASLILTFRPRGRQGGVFMHSSTNLMSLRDCDSQLLTFSF
jgi:hypothetical protein